MKYLSVCSGIEAASKAFGPLGWTPLIVSEIESFPREVLKVRHGAEDARCARKGVGPLLWGDFTSIKRRFMDRVGIDLADVDMLVGGTPCQSFSVAGLRKSLADDRGNLALEFIRLANAIDNLRRARGRPPIFILWENVPGVLSTPDNALGCFLGGMVGSDAALVPPGKSGWTDAGVVDGPKRCAAWRCLDAQHFGLAQRRKRVFVLARGGSGRWACAGALLPIIDSLRWHSAPGRQTRQDVTGTLGSRSTAGGGLGTDFELGGGARANLTPSQEPLAPMDGPPDQQRHKTPRTDCSSLRLLVEEDRPANSTLQQPLPPRGGVGRMDFETETLIAFSSKDSGLDAGNVAPTLRAMGHSKSHANAGGQLAIAHSITTRAGNASRPAGSTGNIVPHDLAHTLRGGGFDAGEDGTGRGTPLVPVAFAENSRAELRLEGGDGQTVSSLKAGGGKPGQSYPAIAFHGRQDPDVAGDKTHPLDTDGHSDAVAVGGPQPVMTVRRLTPEECEKLQGFEPGYTAIDVRGKPAADGPRYRSLGNSMAVPVMRHIAENIVRVLAVDVE